MKCIDRTCDKKAKYIVSKKDLSHRTAEYCSEHTAQFRNYPEFFEIKSLSKKVIV